MAPGYAGATLSSRSARESGTDSSAVPRGASAVATRPLTSAGPILQSCRSRPATLPPPAWIQAVSGAKLGSEGWVDAAGPAAACRVVLLLLLHRGRRGCCRGAAAGGLGLRLLLLVMLELSIVWPTQHSTQSQQIWNRSAAAVGGADSPPVRLWPSARKGHATDTCMNSIDNCQHY